jgi:hypothetical protein
MLESGIATDMLTGRPVDEKVQKKKAKASKAFRDANKTALDLTSELHQGSPVVALLAKQYQDRLAVLANEDTECQTIVKMLQSLRSTLELVPRMAEERMRQVVGSTLEPFIEVT